MNYADQTAGRIHSSGLQIYGAMIAVFSVVHNDFV